MHIPPLRLMTWNILEGFHIPRTHPTNLPEWDQSRVLAAKTLVSDLDPDILVLNEALWCRPTEGHYVDYAKLLGFEHSYGDLYDGVWGNIILSKSPLIHHHRFRIHNRGGIAASILHHGHDFSVATYHPHPSRYPAHKAADYNALLTFLPTHAFALVGDFNAISPADDPDEVALAQAFARFSKTPASSAARFTEGGRAVFAALASLGLRDALEPDDRHFTIPTDMLSMDKSSGMRIDHIWVNDATVVQDAFVLRNDLSNQASDHYPVVADLLINKAAPKI